jgi:hypothetical protein
MSCVERYALKVPMKPSAALGRLTLFPAEQITGTKTVLLWLAPDASLLKLPLDSAMPVRIVNGGLKLTQFSPLQRFKTDTPQLLTCAA